MSYECCSLGGVTPLDPASAAFCMCVAGRQFEFEVVPSQSIDLVVALLGEERTNGVERGLGGLVDQVAAWIIRSADDSGFTARRLLLGD